MLGGHRFLRVPAAGAVFLGLVAEAEADRSYLVEIDSVPQGAKISIDDGGEALVEETPYRGKLAPGTYSVIFELEGYEDQTKDITVRRKRGRQRFFAELVLRDVATISVDAQGAQVLIDGENRGQAPVDIEVPAGYYNVQLVKNGETAYDEWVEVEGGQRLEIQPLGTPQAASAPANAADDDEDPLAEPDLNPEVEGQAGEDESEDDVADTHVLIAAAVAIEMIGRRFRFQNPSEGLRPYSAFGLPLWSLSGELYPAAPLGNRYLAGIGLVGRIARPVVAYTSSTGMEGGSAQTIETLVSELEAGLTYRYPVTREVYVAATVTYGRQQFDFGEVSPPGDLDPDEVPGVDYRFFRFALDVGYQGDVITFNGGVNTPRVSDVGAFQDRFGDIGVFAAGARVGLHLHPEIFPQGLEARMTATGSYYSLTFGDGDADGGTDLVFGIGLGAAYAY